tara:strand:- start:884 stop:2326 length:1443 start_codon:yes stop_codon:yes gene_type:complete
MALNPFFLQGSPSEQRLVQSLINEQLQIYGVEVIYLPRKILSKDEILTEVQSSTFNDNYAIEAYVNTYEGYTGAGDIMTKFGMSLKDELTVTISKERFEDFISSFLADMPASEREVATRPCEGDLIFFPLGQRIFEIKFVEHEQPFYQLGKNYVYQLKCELFELEDELSNISGDAIENLTEDIDDSTSEFGYITSLSMVSVGKTASLGVSTVTGYVRKIELTNDGFGYSKIPTVNITAAPAGGVSATAVAITTSVGDVVSVKEILMVNPGSGYTVAPTINIVSVVSTITGIGSTTFGVGAAATSILVTNSAGIGSISISDNGDGYTSTSSPTITIAEPPSGVGTATGVVQVDAENNNISRVLISDAGIGYTSNPLITISDPAIITGIGTYTFGELVVGSISGAQGRVKKWDLDDKILNLGTTNKDFIPGEVGIGTDSNARYAIDRIISDGFNDKYDKGTEIETAADDIIDFSEGNPFGTF